MSTEVGRVDLGLDPGQSYSWAHPHNTTLRTEALTLQVWAPGLGGTGGLPRGASGLPVMDLISEVTARLTVPPQANCYVGMGVAVQAVLPTIPQLSSRGDDHSHTLIWEATLSFMRPEPPEDWWPVNTYTHAPNRSEHPFSPTHPPSQPSAPHCPQELWITLHPNPFLEETGQVTRTGLGFVQRAWTMCLTPCGGPVIDSGGWGTP